MKRILVIFLLALTVFSLAQAQTTKEHEAIKLEKEMYAALAKGDLAAYLSHITDDAFTTDQNAGLRTKEATAQMLTGRKYERYDFDELKVRDYGEVAIVTGHFSRKVAGTRPNGKPFGEEQGRFTSVWVKRGGRWVRDVYHQSVLPPTPSQSSAEQEILKLRREWAIAYSKGDTEALARIETSDFVVVSDSRINNQRQYERIEQAVKENRWPPGGKGAISVEDDNLRVRIQGDMAIVHGAEWTKIPGLVEQPPENKTAFTEVWVKRDGRWRAMHLQYHTLHPPPSGRTPPK